jgi:2-aminoadipate transaminase
MRLNFSGVDETAIREGIRRIGEVVREQVAMYGTLTGAYPAEPEAERASEADRTAAEEQLATVVKLPAQRKRAS